MQYDRKTILGLKLKHSLQLRKLSRVEMLSRMQILRKVDPIVLDAYREREAEQLRTQEKDSPHGHPWHVSFHASQFPGDDPMACPRAALYQMMDFPAPEPIGRRVRVAGIIGKAMEIDIVDAWNRHGILLSAAPDEKVQTGFELPEAWLTCSVDAVIQPRNWNKPLPIEIKSAYKRDIDAMKVGKIGPKSNHVRQLKVQLAFVRAAQEKGEKWASLDLVTHGYVYYFSRDNPADTAEFRVDYDPRFFELGVARLKEWRSYFEEDFLPSINPSKKHPMGWKWSYPPCQFCDFKKTCKLDHEQNVQALSESVGIARAKLIRPDYDPDAALGRVKKRWNGDRRGDKITSGVSDGGTAAEGQGGGG